MFDVYDLCVKFIEENRQLPYCKTDDMGNSLLLKYCSWCILKNVPNDCFNTSIENFFKETIEGKGDALTKILSDKNSENKKIQIEFLYSKIDYINEFKKYDINTPVDEQKRKKQLELITQPLILNRIINVSIAKTTPIKYHISSTDKNIRMFYFKNFGVFISVGIDFDLAIDEKHTFKEYIEVFKALSDESRLKIVMELSKKSLTPVQLSDKVNITLSTINHHIKKLCECRIVSMKLGDKIQKGIQYNLNTEYFINFLKEVINEIS
ncbi:winged helix-turn-helix transcriptional regulator [Sedimentibacter sp. zth1]|uniref:ArsR/SmtB family transcription factor n=1 Tax=Sedimentibacter sp. zth1 TaxID=2816908 RepID=UPI001A929C32|nr:metalloregulator ArsR/SmtB family transcription factor [Sedimentibacter sp. zth1]QSX04748.1 winged helix-turn-helix transcriptional regulator [Sedimentibacter sp. zth1]